MKKCLIVDDSSVIRKIARRILEEMDFHQVGLVQFMAPVYP